MLTYNDKTEEYILFSNDEKRAIDAGLTLSNRVRGPNGERVWCTKTPYAALEFWPEANEKTQNKLRSYKKDYDKSYYIDSDLDIPSPAGKVYMPFQKAGIEYAAEHNNALIGDEPGLGKTIQAIGLANLIKAVRVLVICPASIRLSPWEKQVKAWSTIPNVRTYPVIKSRNGIDPRLSNYNIISYDLVRDKALHSAIMQYDWDLVVLDEAHYLKSTDAERTRAIFGGGVGDFKNKFIAQRAKRILALTGTPLPNRPREAYALSRAICWEAIDFMSEEDFTYRFNPSGVLANGHKLEMKGRLPELRARLRCNFMIRRLKSMVARDLPDKSYELSYVEPNGAIREVLAKERLLNFNIDDLKDPFAELWGQISTLRKEMGLAKVPRIVEHMKYLLDVVGIEKVVLFSHHREVMNQLKELLKHYGVVEVRGGMSAAAKNNSVNIFKENPDVRIFSGQIEASGFGIDGLQEVCSYVVIGEPAWTPGTNEQAIDRCHRYGQHKNVVAELLVVEGSLDERVLAAVFSKIKTIHGSLDGEHADATT